MTLSTSVDVSDSLDEARTRLLRTARALNGAWAAALCSVAQLVAASLVLLLVATTVRPVYVVIWAILLAATGFNLTRYWPRRPEKRGERLSRSERAALRQLLDPHGVVAWPDVVRLVARPDLELGEGELVLGMPLLACLDETELRELFTVAAMQASVERERAVRWALRVAHGDVGRPLVGRRARVTWPSSRLSDLLRSRAAALEADLGNWAGACERAARTKHRPSADAQAARDQVVEAWAVLQSEWLEPAFARGRRHVAPFTGLRHFVESAAVAGWFGERRPWWPPTGVLAEMVARHEEAVALSLDERGDKLVPITWQEHPGQVTVSDWRALVADVLDVARRTRDDPAVTLDSVLRLLEAEYGDWSEKAAARVLTAAVSVAALDCQRFRPAWSWPDGTRLDDENGWTLPVESIVAEVIGIARGSDGVDRAFAELREALDRLGIDVQEPLWLEADASLRPERPIASFAARQGLAARLVVVTDRALHVFRDPHGLRLARLLVPATPRGAAVELRKRMLTVWQGDTTDQVTTVAADDVRRARVGPGIGGLWWRVTMSTRAGTVVLRGRGDGLAEESELREWLGNRLQRSWLDAPPAVRSIRDAVGLGGVTLGSAALLWGVLLTVLGTGGLPDLLPVVLATGGFAALVVAVLPDTLLELHRRRPRAGRVPTSDEVVRRPARPPGAAARR